jgi:hypothetical protein
MKLYNGDELKYPTEKLVDIIMRLKYSAFYPDYCSVDDEEKVDEMISEIIKRLYDNEVFLNTNPICIDEIYDFTISEEEYAEWEKRRNKSLSKAKRKLEDFLEDLDE